MTTLLNINGIVFEDTGQRLSSVDGVVFESTFQSSQDVTINANVTNGDDSTVSQVLLNLTLSASVLNSDDNTSSSASLSVSASAGVLNNNDSVSSSIRLLNEIQSSTQNNDDTVSALVSLGSSVSVNGSIQNNGDNNSSSLILSVPVNADVSNQGDDISSSVLAGNVNINDNRIFGIIRSILLAGFSSRLIASEVKQKYQPTNQGVPVGPTIFLHKINPIRYGHSGESSTYNNSSQDFDTERRSYQLPTYQVSGLSQQSPSNPDMMTASDLVEAAADILQEPETLQTLQTFGIGIERIRDIRILHFINDKKRFEQEPSFDFTLSFLRTSIKKTPVVSRQRAIINRV